MQRGISIVHHQHPCVRLRELFCCSPDIFRVRVVIFARDMRAHEVNHELCVHPLATVVTSLFKCSAVSEMRTANRSTATTMGHLHFTLNVLLCPHNLQCHNFRLPILQDVRTHSPFCAKSGVALSLDNLSFQVFSSPHLTTSR